MRLNELKPWRKKKNEIYKETANTKEYRHIECGDLVCVCVCVCVCELIERRTLGFLIIVLLFNYYVGFLIMSDLERIGRRSLAFNPRITKFKCFEKNNFSTPANLNVLKKTIFQPPHN